VLHDSVSTTSIRLPAELTDVLDRIANQRGTTRSEVIREAIEAYLSHLTQGEAPDRLTLARRLVTYEGSGKKDLGSRSEEHLREIFGARRQRRSR
jgi:metal-responsive CopG/Arc/MetJ family transcriptional regulator